MCISVSSAHSSAEAVELKLCCMDESGHERCLYKTGFTYFFDQKAFVVDMMVQSAFDGGSSLQLQYGLFPPLSSSEAVREYDLFLTDALRGTQLPQGWSVVGVSGRGGRRVSTVDGKQPCTHTSACGALHACTWTHTHRHMHAYEAHTQMHGIHACSQSLIVFILLHAFRQLGVYI